MADQNTNTTQVANPELLANLIEKLGQEAGQAAYDKIIKITGNK